MIQVQQKYAAFSGDMSNQRSTNVNVGKNHGAIAHIEQKTNRPFQRFICLLHLIELLLRHIGSYFIGETSGPRSFTSSLGKAIVSLKNPVLANFKRIACPNFPIIPEHVIAVREKALFLKKYSLQRGALWFESVQK